MRRRALPQGVPAHRDQPGGADGIIRVDPDTCEHDGTCKAACPYGAIGCDDNDVADKCDFCSHQLAADHRIDEAHAFGRRRHHRLAQGHVVVQFHVVARVEAPEDKDIRDDIWWDPRCGGTGAGYNINSILPIHPAPLVGMQSWYDTICTIRAA